MPNLPYSEIFTELLISIHKALWYCYKLSAKNQSLSESDVALEELFKPFEKKYRNTGLNEHLTVGLTPTSQDRLSVYPRLSRIVIQAYKQVQEIKKKGNYKADILPSPLYILYHALTVPTEPQTASYPFVLCRSMLFYFLNIHPKHPELKNISPKFDSFGEEDVLKSISSFRNHINVQLRWPDPRSNKSTLSTRINYLNGHLLGLKGITHLWFTDDIDAKKDSTRKKQKTKSDKIKWFCESPKNISHLKNIYSNNTDDFRYMFRLSYKHSDLPDASELINWVFGIPIPIRGADVMFFGGLKKASTGGLVASVHGQPGTGKTSTALSLAAVLSPFKTQAVYISLEEDPEDLKTRLNTLIPDYLKSLSIYENNYDEIRKRKGNGEYEIKWFSAFKIKNHIQINELTEILKLLKKNLESEHDIKISGNILASIPAICPLFIVIDNINELFTEENIDTAKYAKLEDLVDQCRNMGAIVLIIGADDIPKKIKIDYLVDISIHLRQEGLDKKYEKPVRVLQLIKTRHQVSRQGTHVFHISNSKGFRISPQVPSQMDKKEKLRVFLPSEDSFIPTLNLLKYSTNPYQEYLRIAPHSQILVHGYGSSGKAGFGLKLLLTPELDINYPFQNKSHDKIAYVTKPSFKINLQTRPRNKVLVVSFLYPIEYYEALVVRLKRQFSKYFSGYDEACTKVNVKAFFPGYLTPEDFVYKIVRLLDEATLDGEPYTGILLDGLHNVFLQFKNLQEVHMVWPLLYSILSRYELTVVTTFTNFSLNERHIGYNELDNKNLSHTPDDFMLMQQGQKPFLHGLVKAADYYFVLEEIIDDNKNYEKNYWLSVRSSIRQTPPKEFLEWNRQEMTLTRVIPSEEVYKEHETGIKYQIKQLQDKIMNLEHSLERLALHEKLYK